MSEVEKQLLTEEEQKNIESRIVDNVRHSLNLITTELAHVTPDTQNARRLSDITYNLMRSLNLSHQNVRTNDDKGPYEQ